jgi:predicted Ser/Thr protein kinase
LKIEIGTIYSADDRIRRETVALKIEKPDKSKRVLMFEFDVLKQIQGLNHTPSVYEFIERTGAG